MSSTVTLRVAKLDRDVIRVVGPDAANFLQGQLSQDVAALDVGASAFSLLLAPQGKLNAYLRVTRLGDDEFLLDVDAGWSASVVERLERFKLRVHCTIETLDTWQALGVRSSDLEALKLWASAHGLVAVPGELHDEEGLDLLGAGERLSSAREELIDLAQGAENLVEIDPRDYDAMRIEAGVGRMGAELTSSTIPAEAGIVDRAASFTKGCYTGQELVARLDSRGNKVPRLLRLVVIEVDSPGPEQELGPMPGCVVIVGDREVGQLTSVAWSHRRKAMVALAYVRREVEVPTDVTVVGLNSNGERWKALLEKCEL